MRRLVGDRSPQQPQQPQQVVTPMKSITFTLALFAICGQTASADGPSSEAVALAIQQLGHSEFEVRQQATDFLWAIGKSITPALEEAAQSFDPEVRLRVESILDRYCHGVFVDTPQREVKLINQFRYGDEREQRRAYRQLAKDGSVDTLLALLDLAVLRNQRSEFRKLLLDRLESDGDVDRILALATVWRGDKPTEILLQRIQVSLRRQVPRLLLSGRFEVAESILLESAATDGGMRDWAVYQLLQGGLAAALEVRSAATSLDDAQRRQLVYMWRADGKLAEARRVAEGLEPESQGLLRGVLLESRDWSGLAKAMEPRINTKPHKTGRNVETLGYAAAAFRLSGDAEQFDAMVELLQELSQRSTAMDKLCAEALLVNHQVDVALEMYGRRWLPIAFEMHCIQEKYGEAFRLAQIDDPHAVEDNLRRFKSIAEKVGTNSVASTTKQFELGVLAARVLYQLGEKDQAMRAFDILATGVQYQRGNSLLEQVVKAEMRVGLWDRACEHAAIMLAKGKYPDPFPSLFPQSSEVARHWWQYLTDQTDMKSAEALRKVGRMLGRADSDPAATTEETLLLVAAAKADAGRLDVADKAARFVALAKTCEIHDRPDLAFRLLEAASANSSPAALALGDSAAEQGDWVAAEKWYLLARDLDTNSYLARYLHGHALIQMGRSEQGEPEVALATLLPLANSTVRGQLAAGLKHRGLLDDAIEQWRLIMRSADVLVSLGGGFRDTALILATQNFGNTIKDDPIRRSEFWETMHLSCLEAQLEIPGFRGYFHTPYVLHKTRARAFLEQGAVDRALSEIQISQAFMPGNIELAEHLVPLLEEAGQSAAAQELFDESYQFVRQVCEEFPDSPLHHNNLAWLCARCDRQLDSALVYIRRALELAPDTPSYLDTLGEVHFRRREFDQAIQCAQRCLELDSKNKFFRQQLERFQAARDETE